MPNYDVIVVGGGPAGLNAALVLARCRRSVLVIDHGRPRNAASRNLHNFLTRDGTPPLELLNIARAEVAAHGVALAAGFVVEVRCLPDGVSAELDDGRIYRARKLLLATGVADQLPDIPGLRDLYGISVHHCPYCDGFQWRDQPLAALGPPREAVNLALGLLTWSPRVTVCTHGDPLKRHHLRRARGLGILFRPERIARLEGREGRLERIVFESGPAHECAALFFNTDQMQRSPLPARLGCRLDHKGHVRTDARGRTGVCNLFLAGDANGDVQFAIVAAAEGAQAAVAINRELQDEDRQQAGSPAGQETPLQPLT